MKSEMKGLKGEPLPKPPYLQQGSGVTLIYTLPSHRFNNIVPDFFETYPSRDKVWFAVDVFMWDGSISKQDPRVNNPFNEIIYRAYVKFRGRFGDYTVRAHLNNPIAVEWGRSYYAYPKHLANILIEKMPNKLFAYGSRNEREIFSLEVAKRGLASSLLSPLFNLYINRLIKEYTGPFNFREGKNEVINVPVTIRSKLSVGKVMRAYFRDLTEWGVLSKEEALKPSYTLLWERIEMEIDPPEITKIHRIGSGAKA